IGIMQAVAQLKLNKNVIGIVPAVENLPDGKAAKPGDIVKSMSGTTIEILNTDAEGRMILADALTFAEKYKPAAVINLATLTGAVVVALGHVAAGIMGNDDELVDGIKKYAEISGEKVWQFPLYDEYKEQIKSDVADIKNIARNGAGVTTAGAFLSKFTEKYKWAHIDIAGVAWTNNAIPIAPKGATGFGVRLLLEWLTDK
ncbi:MAG TPA: leucyl aminopeptidase, partial [Bacteroidetes bacterium]|nr:leucyl aminopeptidase [Bacteroidota bacterium]